MIDDYTGIAVCLDARRREILTADHDGLRIDNETLVVHARLWLA
jgi:hypothetical protein